LAIVAPAFSVIQFYPLTLFSGNGKFTQMESNPTIEQFINNCFRERTAALKLELMIHRQYWLRFFHDECHWNSRCGVIENSEAEKIVSVSPSDIGVGVVTTGSIKRLRYRVKPSAENWLIHDVDMGCGLCQVKGVDAECVLCDGTGWLAEKDRARIMEQQRNARVTSPIPVDELGGGQFRNSNIEEFMTGHFREHAATARKQAEIHAAYRQRFYSPGCDWDNNEKTVQWCEAERIVGIVPAGKGVYVITDGFSLWRLRYNLRQEGNSWLIWEVNTECPLCNRHGKKVDCHICGGTGWTTSKGKGGRGPDKFPGGETPPEKPRWQP